MHEIQKEYEELEIVRKLQLLLTQLAIPPNDYILKEMDPAEEEEFKRLCKKIHALLWTLNKFEFDEKGERATLETIRKEFNKVEYLGNKIFSSAQQLSDEEVEDIIDQLNETTQHIVNDAEKFYMVARVELNRLRQGQRRTHIILNHLVISGLFFSIILIIGSLLFFRRTISEPLYKLREVALEVGKGNLDKKVDIKLRDEIGELGKAFNKMIDDLKETQAQLIQAEKMGALGQLAAGVAHEIKNPLAIIIQGIEFIRSSISSDKMLLDAVNRIKEATVRADKIVRDLLNFSKQTSVAFEEVDILNIINESISLIEYQLGPKNIKIIRDLPPSLPKIKGDITQLKQIFINIILNAVDAMPEGGTITIKAEEVEKEGNKYIRISVKDTGTGIPEEILQKVFDPFFTTKKKEKSAGLGLSVTKGLVEKHGGNIEIKSKVGEGTTVIIELPVA
jgi:signal transduction histidine kinase